MDRPLLLSGKTQEEIMGFASANRDMLHGLDRKLFNSIIHCLDKDPHYYGNNIFAGEWDNDKLDTVRNILEDKIIKYKLQDKINKHPLDDKMMPMIMDNMDKRRKINSYKSVLEKDNNSCKKENIILNKYLYLYENLYHIFISKGWLKPGNNAVIGNEVTEESFKQEADMLGIINNMLIDDDEPMGQNLMVPVNLMLMMMEAQVPTYDEYKELKEKNKKYHKMLEIHFKGE